jgi:(hydroxyamino)benzene mutase
MTDSLQRRLFFFGMALFLLGLITGFVSPAFKNPRMGLSAHLEGVMNGMFLILVGLIWERIQIPARSKVLAFFLVVYASFANWLACILGGVFGASRMTPIAGMGHTAEPWQELVVAILFVSVGLTMALAVALFAWGLRVRRD